MCSYARTAAVSQRGVAERNAGQLALLRVPLSRFSDGRDSALGEAYLALPTPSGPELRNRYIGSYLLYGAGTAGYGPQTTPQAQVYAGYAAGERTQEVPLAHSVDRIEALGTNAVVVGTDGKDLHFTSVRLGSRAESVGSYTRANASSVETRSHGFYYRPLSADEGIVGLPVMGDGRAASVPLRRTSASLHYLRNRSLNLTELGALDSTADETSVRDLPCLMLRLVRQFAAAVYRQPYPRAPGL